MHVHVVDVKGKGKALDNSDTDSDDDSVGSEDYSGRVSQKEEETDDEESDGNKDKNLEDINDSQEQAMVVDVADDVGKVLVPSSSPILPISDTLVDLTPRTPVRSAVRGELNNDLIDPLQMSPDDDDAMFENDPLFWQAALRSTEVLDSFPVNTSVDTIFEGMDLNLDK